MSEKKYLIFGDHCLSGFGNKLQSLMGWYVFSKFTGRDFIITNNLLTSALQSRFNKSNFPTLSIGPTRDIVPQSVPPQELKRYFDIDFPATNFYSMKEPFLEAGAGRPMLYEVRKNKYFNSDFRKLFQIYHDEEKLIRSLYKEIFRGVTPQFKQEAQKYFDFTKHKYSVVQFRAFFDSGPLQWSSLPLLDAFLDNFKKIKNEHIPPNSIVLVQSDDTAIAEYIRVRIQKIDNTLDVRTTEWPKCKSCGKMGTPHSCTHVNNVKQGGGSLLSIVDWLLMGHADFIYCTRTSFAQSCARFFNKTIYFTELEYGKSGKWIKI